jgi:flagellar motor switch protein FliN
MARLPFLRIMVMALKLIQHLESALGQAAASMTGKTFAISSREGADETAEPDVQEGAIVWQQSFSAVDGPSLWLSASQDLWEALGRLTFQAAGLDEVTDADCRSTWLELLNQTVAGIASGLSADLGREVTVLNGEETSGAPRDMASMVFDIAGDAGQKWVLRAAWTPALGSLGEPRADEERSPAARDNAASHTFDLLLDVALPVSVSFGRTSLQVREVLKLNTGSIVELDRFVADPVEVIVNNCVIARGEVVVVDGNYGVRINQLASRDERLRSGMSEAARKTEVRP